MRWGAGLRRWLGGIVLLAAAAAASAQPAAASVPAGAGTLVFFGDRDHAPYEFLEDGMPRGASVDLIEALGRQMGRRVEIRLLDWDESQRRLLAGEGHALTMMARNRERELRYDFSQPTLPMSLSLFVRSSEAAAFDQKNLAGRRIGVTAAGVPRIVLSREHPLAQLVVVADPESGTHALLRGELDALAAVTWVELHLLHRLGLRGVTPLPPFRHLRASIAVRRGETELLGEIDRALTALQANGEMERIVDRWQGERIYTFTGLTVRMGWIAVGVALVALVALVIAIVLLQRERARLAHEVSVRVRAEAAAESRAIDARMLQRMASELAAATTPEEVGAALLGLRSAFAIRPRLWLAKPHRTRPAWRLLACSDDADAGDTQERAPNDGEVAVFDATAAHGGRLVVGDRSALLAAMLPRAQKLPSLDALGGDWFYATALRAAGSLPTAPAIGVLILAWDDAASPEGAPRGGTSTESLDSVAALVAQALERTRVRQAERRAAAQQAALRSAASALAAASDNATVRRVVAEQFRENFAQAFVALALFDDPPEPGHEPAAGAMLTVISDARPASESAATIEHIAADAERPIAVAAREGRSLYFDDRAALEAGAPALASSPHGAKVQALAALPLQAPATTDASLQGRSTRLGALAIRLFEPHRFDAEDRAFLETLAGMAARAVERCRLLERLQASLARSEEAGLRTRLAMEANGMGSWDLDLMTMRVEWNSRMYSLLGLSPGSGQEAADRFFDRIHPEDRQSVREALERAIADNTDFESSFRVQAEQGQVRWLLGRGRTLERRGAGPARRMLGITFDITPLMQARHELEAADRNKDEFLAMVSHELRNPLSPILNAAAMLARAGDRAEVREKMVPLIQRQIRQMTHLIDDLLELSRVRHGRIALEREPVDAASAVQQALEAVRPAIERHEHHVDVRPPPEALYIDADRARLIQMLSNLLGNAAKYTAPGGRIEVDIERENDQAVLRISDNGMGIAPEFLPRLFDLFTQDRRSLSRAEGGLGLGLALVKRLADLHGGSVEVASAGRGQGACFTLRLPLAADQRGSVASYSPPRDGPTYADRPAA